MGSQAVVEIGVEGEIHLPGQQQIIDRLHQLQQIPMAEVRAPQGEIHIGGGLVAQGVPAEFKGVLEC